MIAEVSSNTCHRSDALDALELQEARTINRMQQLEATLSNLELDVVSRAKAKVELTLLNEWALKAMYEKSIAERDAKIAQLQLKAQEKEAQSRVQAWHMKSITSGQDQVDELQHITEDQDSMQQLHVDLLQLEKVILQQKQENENLTKCYQDKVAKLERINEDQRVVIDRMKQQLSKVDSEARRWLAERWVNRLAYFPIVISFL